MKITVFKKIILLCIITNSFSNLLQSTPTADVINDLKASPPDLVKTLQDGIALRDYYTSAGQPKLFAPYEAQLEEFFYHNIGMPFDDVCEAMTEQKMTPEQIIPYLKAQNSTKGKDSKAYEDFYNSVISTITANVNLAAWNVQADKNPTDDSIKANKDALVSALGSFNGNQKGILIDTLFPWFYTPIETTTLKYLKNSEIVFNDGTGSYIKLNATTGDGDASIGEVTNNGTSPSKNYMKNYSLYQTFVAQLVDIVISTTRAVFRGNKSFDSGDGYFETQQKWFNTHKLGDLTSNGLKAQLLQAIG